LEELAVEVLQCPLRSGAGRRRKEEEGGGRRRKEASNSDKT